MARDLMWQRLERRLTARVEKFPGAAGVCVRDAEGRGDIEINAQEPFPTASTIKIHVLTQLLSRAERGELDLDAMMTVTKKTRVPGSGVIAHLEGDVTLTLRNLAILMITLSDNTATNLCIDAAGIDETNALLRRMGFSATTLRRKMQDPEAIAADRENVSTPAECVDMLLALRRGEPSPWVAGECLAILQKPNDGPIKRAVPAGVPVASKPGGMDRVQCDAGLVSLPRRPYAVAIMTKFGMTDADRQRRWVFDTARMVHRAMTALDGSNRYGLGLP